MAIVKLDAKGLKCPMPTLKITTMVTRQEAKPGDILEAVADCPTFEKDVKAFCAMYKKVLVLMRDEGNGVKRCQIQI
jgi:tRNA 2-thiouridine synthesizing protein A